MIYNKTIIIVIIFINIFQYNFIKVLILPVFTFFNPV